MAIICVKCGSVRDRAVKTMQGSFWAECLLWLLFILPGLIYSVWRLTTKARVCAVCGSREIVPLSTPVGQKLQREFTNAAASTNDAQAAPPVAVSRCAGCGHQKQAGSSFCSHCGAATLIGSQPIPGIAMSSDRSVAVAPVVGTKRSKDNGKTVALVSVFAVLVLVITASILTTNGSQAKERLTKPTVGSLTSGSTDSYQFSRIPTRASVHDGAIVAASGTLPCGATKEALDEMTKWAVRGDTREMAITLLRTGSAILKKGDDVKVLDLGFMTTKVRILSTGRECWVATEAVR